MSDNYVKTQVREMGLRWATDNKKYTDLDYLVDMKEFLGGLREKSKWVEELLSNVLVELNATHDWHREGLC